MERTGIEMLLRELEKYYQKVSRVYKLSKLKEFYNIRRELEENMEEYIRRYERVAREMKRVRGREIAEEVRGWHLLEQAGLEELEEQVVVGAYHTQDGYNHIKAEMTWIFGDKGKKEAKSWLEGGRGKKEMQQGATGSGCFVCGEVGHWARWCKRKNDPGNVRCYTCGERRHIAQGCRREGL